MKTIEEKAKEYAHVNRGIYVTEKHVEKAYVAGAQEAIASQWRDAEVELPEDGVEVLAWTSVGAYVAFISNNAWEDWEGNSLYVTHWMPIPEPPKNEKGE